ncbi:hypothetical protein [Mycobacterium sp. 3519A]|uniref:hypothetical protein n=1 Tax=Mycobacterium sp. 3519A TaxID=2057184 RepID=UPI001F1AB00D|nr:hypothetical protein [Mycobacterium sp. 3519A]
MTVAVTVLVVGKNSGGGESPTPTNGNGSEFASANDKGPVGIITEDPTCDAWGRVSQEYSAATKAANWSKRDSAIPASAWTTDQRSMYEDVANAMTSAGDQTVNLTKLTPHRVMRELYQQFIAYGKGFANSVPNYSPQDDNLAVVTDSLTSALSAICSAINYRSAPTVAPLIASAEPPSTLSHLDKSAEPKRFLTSPNGVCAEWGVEMDSFSKSTAEWRAIDPSIPAANWTPEQRAVNDAVVPELMSDADTLEQLGRRSQNAIFEDIAVLLAQYQRGFAKAIPTYTSSDNYLSNVATYLAQAVNWACKASGG